MKEEARDRRRDEILDVAVALLAERGYRDASMIEIARHASASKETLYAWFGDKRGLFESVIRRNAASVQEVLDKHLEADAAKASPDRALADFGTALLTLLLGESAVAINRAAISEAPSDSSLAKILASAGRDATLPRFLRVLTVHAERGALDIEKPEEAAEAFLGLLLGDYQVRRLLGLIKPPTKSWCRARAERATGSFLRLYGA